MLGDICGEVRFKESLSYYTSLRIGGPADILVAALSVEDICHALDFASRERLPVLVLGGGNNVLVSDHGVRGLVIQLDGCLSRAQFHGEEAVAGGGMPLSSLIREAAGLNLGGLECLVGIPGTVGGALGTNAGTDEGRIRDLVSSVYFLYPDGSLGELKRDVMTTLHWAYELPPGAVVVGCRIPFHRRPRAEIQSDLKRRMHAKRAAEPIALASAGWIWENPAGEQASCFIEQAGLRGRRMGGAEIPDRDTNFIVNHGSATVADVKGLIQLTRERVHHKFGLTLNLALHLIGD